MFIKKMCAHCWRGVCLCLFRGYPCIIQVLMNRHYRLHWACIGWVWKDKAGPSVINNHRWMCPIGNHWPQIQLSLTIIEVDWPLPSPPLRCSESQTVADLAISCLTTLWVSVFEGRPQVYKVETETLKLDGNENTTGVGAARCPEANWTLTNH